ncbi:MAG: hypothetical protein DI539_28760 [Flavobacterium psychrophilum]|nr:MAG: hypothetical protein DI539_28760 [Flavobacterium psychrophilum]
MLFQIWPDFDPDSISVDYEQAAINAINDAFPESAVHGCLFHLMKNMRKCLCDNNMIRDYNNSPEVALNCRTIAALAFVPEHDVPNAFEELKRELGNDYAEVLKWFEKNYVGKCL